MKTSNVLLEIAPINVCCDSCGTEIETGKQFIADLNESTIHCMMCSSQLQLLSVNESNTHAVNIKLPIN